jgi:uncharacterized protein (TIGR02099 family)
MLKISFRLVTGAYKFLRRSAMVIAMVLMFVVTGLFLTMRYSILPDIEQFHNDITGAVSKAIGLTVEIEKIEADWHGIGPHLRLSEIRILDKQHRTSLALQQVDVVVSWMTLLAGEMRLASLEIDHPDLLIKRDMQGLLQISGVQLGGSSTDNNFSNMLLNQSKIAVRGAHISWLDEQHGKPMLIFNNVNLLIENRWNFHRFAIRATPPAELSSELDVRGDFYGTSFDNLQGWSGEIYTQLNYADLPAWKAWLPLPAALKQGKGALRGWLGIDDGKLSHITTDLALVNVQTRLAEDLPPLDINVLSGRVGWKETAQSFEIATNKFSLKLFNNFVLKPTDIFISLSNMQDIRTSTGEIRANLLELDGLGKLMEFLPIEKKLKEQLAEFSPQGSISNLQAKWNFDNDKQLHYKLKAKLSEMALQRVGKLPGFSGVSGEVDGNETSGNISLNSHNFRLDAPQFMAEPLAFESITAQSGWKNNKDGVEVNLRNFAAENADLAGTAYGSFHTLESSPGYLDINIHLNRAMVTRASKYIPLIALGTDARKWMNNALLAGQSNDFNIRLKGNLSDFPFAANRKGIFKVNGHAKGVALAYEAGWPRIDNGNVDFLLQGKEMEITTSSAISAGINLRNVKVSIPDILSNDLMLRINGEADTENTRALAFIKTSPVRGYLGGLTDDIIATGNGKLSLNLVIPLSGPQPVKVAGTYHFIESEVEIDKRLPTLRKVNGDLLFTESGVSTQNIVAQILGGPSKLTIDKAEDGAVKIKLGGKANFGVLRALNPSPLLSKLSGQPEWNVEIGVKNKQSKVLITSNLQGFKSELPEPLAKRAETFIPLRIEINYSSPTQIYSALQYGSQLNANILQTKDVEGSWNIKRGIINFGNVIQKADKEGLWVIGTLPHLSLEGWSDLASSDEDSEPVSLAGADLVVQKVTGYDNTFNNLHIKATSRNDILMGQLSSKEINGEVSWQAQDNGKLVARLKNLDLTLAEGEKVKKDHVETAPTSKPYSPVELPEIDLIVDKLNFKGLPVGKLELLAKQDEQTYLLDHLRLINPDGVLTISGKWKMSADAPRTEVNVKSEIHNAGNVLARSGFPNSVKNGSGKWEGSFTWPGSPAQFNKTDMSGRISLDTGKGQFLQIDPGIGKLLSILSLQALPKHITLDFEDVFSKGFEFDSIKGDAEIKQGVVVTDNLKIEGSAAKVSMQGQIDLNSETQNLRIRIVPAVGNSAALISALVATPVVGAGVYLASKILNDPLGQMASFEYNVSGSWADPKVEKVGEKKP